MAENRPSLHRSSASAARWWLAMSAESQAATTAASASADESTSTPNARTRSSVPPSTRLTYGMALPGEYSMSTRRAPPSSRAERLEQLVAAAVGPNVEAEAREVARVDVVDQQARVAVARDVQERAAGGLELAGAAEQAGEGGVGAAEVVDEPAVGGDAFQLVGDAAAAL